MKCNKCGQCCRTEEGQYLGGNKFYHDMLKGPTFNGLTYCQYLKIGKDGASCSIYNLRPLVCTLYPNIENAVEIDGCGLS